MTSFLPAALPLALSSSQQPSPPDAAGPGRHAADGGPDFATLMQRQADRQAALRALDAATAPQPATTAPAAATLPPASQTRPGSTAVRTTEATAAQARSDRRPDAGDVADAADRAQQAGEAADSAPSAAGTPSRRTAARPAADDGRPAQPGSTDSDLPLAEAPADEAVLASGAGLGNTSTTQWARQRLALRAQMGAAIDTRQVANLAAATTGTPGTALGDLAASATNAEFTPIVAAPGAAAAADALQAQAGAAAAAVAAAAPLLAAAPPQTTAAALASDSTPASAPAAAMRNTAAGRATASALPTTVDVLGAGTATLRPTMLPGDATAEPAASVADAVDGLQAQAGSTTDSAPLSPASPADPAATLVTPTISSPAALAIAPGTATEQPADGQAVAAPTGTAAPGADALRTPGWAASQASTGGAASRAPTTDLVTPAPASAATRSLGPSPDAATLAGTKGASATGRSRAAPADTTTPATATRQADASADSATSDIAADRIVAAPSAATAGATEGAAAPGTTSVATPGAAPGQDTSSAAMQVATSMAAAVTTTTNSTTDAGRSDAAVGPARSTERAAAQAGATQANMLRGDFSHRASADGVASAAGPRPDLDRRNDTSAQAGGPSASAWQQVTTTAPAPAPAGSPSSAVERAGAAFAAVAQAASAQPGIDGPAPLQSQPLAVNGVAGAQPGALVAFPQPAAVAPLEARIPVALDQPGFGAALGTQVSVMVQGGVQTAQLQLNPAEMGPIAVQIALDGSAARVDFQADLASTRAVIEASLPALAGALQDAGFTLAGGGVFQQAPGGRQGQGDGQPQPGQPRLADARADANEPLPGPAVTLRSQRGLVDLVA